MKLPTHLVLAAALLLGAWHRAAAQQATPPPEPAPSQDTRLAQRLDTEDETPASPTPAPAVAPTPVVAAPATAMPEGVTEIALSGTVLDAGSRQPVPATIDVLDNATGQLITQLHCSPEGKYAVNLPTGTNYGLVVRNGAYPFHSENVTLPARVRTAETVRDFRLQKLEPGTNIVLNNVFFEPNKAVLRPESAAELERLVKLLADKPKLKVKLCGHTNDSGSMSENLLLSQRRAQAIANYLTEHKIKAERLTTNGYGASIPLPSGNDGESRPTERTAIKVMAD
jgi:outer membrane protein OmpA-like peptidoglycan-associated protein